MTLIDRLLGAIAADLGLPPENLGPTIEEWKFARLRLLSGFDPDYQAEDHLRGKGQCSK